MAMVVGELMAVIGADASKYFQTAKRVEGTHESLVKKTSGDKAVIDADARPFERETQRAIRTAGIMRTKIGSFIGEMRGELLAVGAVAGIIGGFRSVVMAASDLSESANAINVTFGDAAGQVMQFTSGASKSIGQSDTEARQAAATFGVYGKQAGLATDQNAQFSISLVKLASDLASFRNTSPAEAIEAIGAALRGESDPIEKYGVLLTEAVIQQRALQMGVIQTTSQALTPQQRVLVAYQEILTQTTDAQGDFGRTSGELANQLRTLRARAIDGAASIGQSLLPAATSLVGFLNTAVGPAFALVGNVLKVTLGFVGDVADAFTSLPGPVQAALAALVAWRLMQDRVTEGASSLGDRLTGPWRRLREEMEVQHALAAAATTRSLSQMIAVYGEAEGAQRYFAQSTESNLTRVQAGLAALQVQYPTIGAMGESFRRAKGDGDGFASSLRGIGAAAGTGLKAGLTGLMGVLGGPWGIAIAAGTVLLGAWIAANQKAKARQEELAAAGKRVAAVIREQNGEINKATRAGAAKEAEDSGLLEMANKLGISLPKVTDAILGQGNAYNDIRGKVLAAVEAKEREIRQSQDRSGKTQERLQGEIDAYNQLLSGLEEIIGGRNADTESQRRLAAATGLTTEQVAALAGAASAAEGELTPMGKAIATMGDESATTQEKISALQQALDEMTQKNLTVEEATQAINDTLRGMAAAFEEARKEAANAGVELVNSAGAIDTTTAAGSTLQNQIQQLSSDYNGLFAATVEAAQAQGKELPEAIAAAVQATGPMRQSFLDIADAAGLNDEQIQALAGRYGLLPSQVATMINQPGMLEALIHALGLKGNIEAIPDQWSTVLSSTAPEQIELMRQLGFKVETLPNGDVLITVDSAAAEAEIDRVTSPRTVRITLQAAGYHGQQLAGAMKQLGNAKGRIAEYYAEGGVRPMSANTAAIVGSFSRTGVLRVIADNPVADEAFIPLQRHNARSQAILDEALVRMRPEWFNTGGAVAGGGSTGSGGRPGFGAGTYVDNSDRSRSIVVNAAPSVPTLQQIRDLQHEQEILYGS